MALLGDVGKAGVGMMGAAGDMGGFVPLAARAAAVAGVPLEMPGNVMPPANACKGPEAFFDIIDVNWCDEDAPALADAAMQGVADKDAGWFFRSLFGYKRNPKVLAGLPWWACQLFGPKPGYAGLLVAGIVYIPLQWIDSVYAWFSKAGCNAGVSQHLAFQSSILGIGNKLLGVDLGPAAINTKTTADYACPTIIVRPGDAVAAYLHGEFTHGQCVNWCKANAWCPNTTDMAVSAGKHRLDISTLVDLWKRGKIADEDSLKSALRRQGVLDGSVSQGIIDSSYTKWGVGEIYRALHVLRPGRVDPSIEYTESDARADLRSLGYDYRRIDKMIYLAKTDVSFRQMLKPFEQGVITTRELTEYMRDSGFNERDTAKFVQLFERDKQIYQWSEAGGPTLGEANKLAASGEITGDVYRSIYEGRAATPTEEIIGPQVTNVLRQVDSRAASIKAVQAGLRSGEYNEMSAIEALQALQVPNDEAINIVHQWLIEQSYKTKPASAGELCSWHGSGLLSNDEYAFRLRQLGYSATDVNRIMRICVDKERAKQEALEKKAENERQRKAAQAAKGNIAAAKSAANPPKTAAQIKAARVANLNARLAKQAERQISGAEKIGSHVATREKQQATGKLTGVPGPDESDTADIATPE